MKKLALALVLLLAVMLVRTARFGSAQGGGAGEIDVLRR